MATTLPGATAVLSKPRTKLLAALRKSDSSNSSESSADSASDASESEDGLSTKTTPKPLLELRPQRRVQSPEVEEEEVDAESAYQRMKQRLAAEKKSQEQQTQKVTSVSTTAISSDEEEEAPVRKPVRKAAVELRKSLSPRTSPSPSIRSRRSSPGLFVSPHPTPTKKKSPTKAANASDSDEPVQRPSNTDLQERVKRIRAERLAKQREEETQQATQKASKLSLNHGAETDSDGEIDRRLTQQSKPTRRAGKKALEAMARDQQRISRNMQLTHQSKTKKRYSTKDLFSKFGFSAPDDSTTSLPTPEPSSALASSDAEAQQKHDTPPTSPPCSNDVMKDVQSQSDSTTLETMAANEATPVPRVDKGKGRAPEFQHLPIQPWMAQAHTQPTTVRHALVQARQPSATAMVELSDSEDDAQATPKSRFAVFDRIRTKEQQDSKSFVTLRHLAHLTSPKNTRKGPKTISRSEMHFSLAQKARQQAQKMREERLEELRRRGIHVETAEEREKNQMEIEDMVAQFEKQRQEDLKLAKLEKKEAKANGQPIDGLPSSDESDDDYVGSGEENAAEADDDLEEEEEEVALELSGSEDEQVEDDDNDELDGTNDPMDGVAGEDALPPFDGSGDEDDETSAPVRRHTAKRIRRVIDDEDESENDALNSGSPTQQATQDDAKAAFGFGNTDTGLGLTQMFAGTMANLDDSQSTYQEPEQDSLDFLRSLPDTQPGVNFSQTDDTLVPNSQLLMTPRKESQVGVESQFSLGIGQLVGPSPSRTQLSEAPEPTQDAGFSFSRSPAGFMAPISTTETVMMSVAESPIKKRAGKLQRGRRESAVELSDVEEDLVDAASDMSDVDDIQRPPKHRDAFRAMQKGAKKQKAVDDFNKNTSLARDIVEEQADESEDEYAGIGGNSDDDSGEEDEEMKNMIDHNDVKVDERQLAAFYA
jgi:mediator of replication checkpoint protein 1